MSIASLKEEFTGKTNHEAYELAFTKRVLRPHPTEPGAYLGNTQRQEFSSHLKHLVQMLPAGAQIFDIGAGGGEIIETALKDVSKATINLVEPNPVLLAKYRQRLQQYPHITEGISHCGPLQDYYADAGVAAPAPAQAQHLVLAIHMLYHLTSPTAQEIAPDADLERAISTMFDFLAPGGSIFVVFANQLVSTTGQAGRYYFNETGRPEITERLLRIAASRERLLGRGEIVSLLNRRFGANAATITSLMTPSCFYGDNEDDIVAMCITAEIGDIDDSPFDLGKLETCARFVKTHAAEIGLTVEEGDVAQRGMVRSNQPQMVAIISKQ